MPIPDFQTIMRPLLLYVKDGKERTVRQAIDSLADEFGLSEDERKELLPSGQDVVFNNRLRWAMTHLRRAGLISTPRRGVFTITELGLKALDRHPNRVDVKALRQYDGYQESRSAKKDRTGQASEVAEPEEQTPEEMLATGYQRIREELVTELRARLKECSPAFFEQLVVDLLVRMGYGGSREDAGRAVGKSGDEGIDGIIKEDRLGLSTLYTCRPSDGKDRLVAR